MVANEMQPHVMSCGVEKLQSDLFERDHEFPPKDKDFISSILAKRRKDITTKDLNKLKDIVRLHVPSNLRVKLWMLLSGGADEIKATENVYSETCETLFADGAVGSGDDYDEYDDQREMVTYYLTEEGIKTVQKVLIVVKDIHPDITSCPLLEPIIAIFLHFMDENQCYACISGLIGQKKSFLEQTKFDNALTDMSLQDVFKSVNKKGHARLKSFMMTGSSDDKNEDNDDDDASEMVLFPLWRNMIFGKLDLPIVVRIMDCLLVEGAKILYRVGLHLLNLFHYYSLQFQNMQFSDSQDLIATIAQYTQSLDDQTTEEFMKSALKVKFTSKELSKINNNNSKLYKRQLWQYIRSDAFNKFTKQVIAVNLNQVSDIIKPVLWLQICEWLPARIQLKQPYVLFSTNTNGFNLKTLYNHCEEEEQTLLILHTDNGETLGAYLSAALIERHDGRSNLTYFGTGETFIFRLAPSSVCYLWNKKVARGCQHGQKSKYVFVEPAPHHVDGRRKSNRRSGGGTRKSLMRRLSRRLSAKQIARSQSTPNTERAKEYSLLEPLSAINLKYMDSSNGPISFDPNSIRERSLTRNQSLPDKMPTNSMGSSSSLEGQANNFDTKKISGKVKTPSKDLPDDASHIASSHLETKEPYDVVHKHVEFRATTPKKIFRLASEEDELDDRSGVGDHLITNEPHVVHKHVGFQAATPKEILHLESDDVDNSSGDGSEDDDDEAFSEDKKDPPASLFISCDNSTFVVGGGSGQGLYFDGDIQIGRSSRCETYRNDSLTYKENGDFVITRLDVFGFK